MKKCSKCKILKDESEFSKDSSRKDKLCYTCKTCRNKNFKNWRSNNKDYQNNYRRDNLEKTRKVEKKSELKRKDQKKIQRIKYRNKLRSKAVITMGGCCELCRTIPKKLKLFHFHHVEYQNGKRDIGIRLYKRIINRNTHGLKLLCIRCHSILHKKGGYLKYQKMS